MEYSEITELYPGFDIHASYYNYFLRSSTGGASAREPELELLEAVLQRLRKEKKSLHPRNLSLEINAKEFEIFRQSRDLEKTREMLEAESILSKDKVASLLDRVSNLEGKCRTSMELREAERLKKNKLQGTILRKIGNFNRSKLLKTSIDQEYMEKSPALKSMENSWAPESMEKSSAGETLTLNQWKQFCEETCTCDGVYNTSNKNQNIRKAKMRRKKIIEKLSVHQQELCCLACYKPIEGAQFTF